MKKLLVLILTVFVMGCFSMSMATQAEQPGPTIKKAEGQKRPTQVEKTTEVLQQELAFFRGKYQALIDQKAYYLYQMKFLQQEVPRVDEDINNVVNQIRQYQMEIQKRQNAKKPVEEPEEKK